MKTLKEVLDTICSEMTLSDKLYVKRTQKDDLILFHSTVGRYIRNTFNLWSGNPELLIDMNLPKGCHADEVSQAIIEALWNRLRNEP